NRPEKFGAVAEQQADMVALLHAGFVPQAVGDAVGMAVGEGVAVRLALEQEKGPVTVTGRVFLQNFANRPVNDTIGYTFPYHLTATLFRCSAKPEASTTAREQFQEPSRKERSGQSPSVRTGCSR